MVTYRLEKQLISLELPDTTKKEIDFTDTSLFTTSPNRHLPTPAQVRALSKDIDTRYQPTPIKFENLNLIVKFGPHVTTVEALNKKVFRDKVPVTELFGWRVDDEGYVFIYMELIEGPTLDECWNCLGTIEKRAISDQPSRITETLRQLEQDPSDHFIVSKSSMTGSLVQSMCTSRYWEIKFTHAELNRRNIIVSFFTPVQIVIVNWQQAGYYPDYWEYCKASYTCWDGEWRKDYVDKFLQPPTDVYTVLSGYCIAMGTD